MSHSDNEVVTSKTKLKVKVRKHQKRNSYVGAGGEWETRKITFMGVVRSFVSQLRIGQDLTKKSMPAIFCNPYSVLEFISYRVLGTADILYDMLEENDPVQKMALVASWILSLSTQETLEKKPYNPILGELHSAYTECDEFGRTDFVAEQVSHHPPVSAYRVYNSKLNLEISGYLGFQIKFHYNSATVSMNGPVTIRVGKEIYEADTLTPNIVVRNIIFGTRRLQWENDTVNVTCDKTGLKAELTWKQNGKNSDLKGGIVKGKKKLQLFEGSCGDVIYLVDKETDEEQVLIDYNDLGREQLKYDRSFGELDSMEVWKDVSEAIIANDMPAADQAKQKVENDQRARIAARNERDETWAPRLFVQNTETGHWSYKGGDLEDHVEHEDQ